MQELKEQIDKKRLPHHVGVIMDGNGRWAKGKGKPRVFGHHSAVEAVRATVEACAELGVGYLTLYAFSTENWSRPEMEVGALMQLLVDTIGNEMKMMLDNGIRLATIGDTSGLPEATQEALRLGIEQTATGDGMTLILALNYSGKWDLARAARQLAGGGERRTARSRGHRRGRPEHPAEYPRLSGSRTHHPHQRRASAQ